MVNQKSSKLSYVVKRDGRQEEVHFDKITSRIKKLCYGLNMDYIDPVSIMLKVVNAIFPGITTTELDSLTADIAFTMSDDHPDYATLAARIAISNLQKQTKKHLSDVVNELYNVVNFQNGQRDPMISDKIYEIVNRNADALNSCIIYDRDFYYSYCAIKMLEQNYLLKINGKVVERPQHMLMRTALAIHGDNIASVIETYNLLSERYYTHASATMYSASSTNSQLMSSHQIMMPDDSIEGIYRCIRQCGILAKYGGNISFSVQNIRAKGSYIAGTNGISNGLVPMLRVFDTIVPYAENLNNERSLSLSVYLEPWHADIFEFLDLGKPIGKEEVRARNLSYALWIPDLFMRRVEENSSWSLMCPNSSVGLTESFGEEFEKLYLYYEAEKQYIRQVPAQDLWKAITVAQSETGGPTLLFKDACNMKSNQKNLGPLKSASFYGECVQFTSCDEIASCPQASIALDKFVDTQSLEFDFEKLKNIARIVAINLDKLIDNIFCPLSKQKKYISKHRSIGIGVQGLADAFILMNIPFDSEDASRLNSKIAETVYYGALEGSCAVAEREGSYPTYEGSPISKGVLQYDMWNISPSGLWDWSALKEKISTYGVRNSVLLAQAPAQAGSYILDNNPGIEPYSSFIFPLKMAAGEYLVMNPHLLKTLTERGIWEDSLKEDIMKNNGSIQDIAYITDDIKAIFKTVWDMSQKIMINMVAERAPFVDQSQSFNVYLDKPTYAVMSSVHFYSWRKGVKTGINKMKIKPVAKGSRLTNKAKVEVKVDEELEEIKKRLEREEEERNMASLVCSLKNPEACEMCGA